MGLIRYPGSKAKITKPIIRTIHGFVDRRKPGLFDPLTDCYCEPFFGSGAVGFKVLNLFTHPDARLVINDIDPAVACLWAAVRDQPGQLIGLIRDYIPCVDDFQVFRQDDPNLDPVVRGFRKLALHQISFSGLGAKAGGPIGGSRQRSAYNVACRWNPARLAKRVRDFHHRFIAFREVEVLNLDFEPVLDRLPPTAVAYLDPPYYVQGPQLYLHSFTEDDHARLAAVLRRAAYRFVLSYDDHPRVRELYSWARIDGFEMTPSVQTAKSARRKNQEIVIRNFD